MIDRKVFIRLLLTIGLPIALQQIILLSLNMINTFMTGSIGMGELAVVGVASKVYLIFSIICFGIYSGSSIYISQYWGIRDVENIRKVIAIGMRIGFFLALFIVGLVLVLVLQILHLFAGGPDAVAINVSYLHVACFMHLMTAFSFLINFNSHAIHNLKVLTLAGVLAIATSAALNYGLIFGNFHPPRLGVEGATITTLTAKSVETLLILGYAYFSEDHPLVVDGTTIRKLDVLLTKRVVKTVSPMAMSENAWSIGTTVCFITYDLLGTGVVTAVQVASTINGLFQCMFFGLRNACAIMVGNELRRNHTKLAYSYGRVFTGINIGSRLAITAALLPMKGRIINIYNYDAAVSQTLDLTLIIYALYTTPKMVPYVHIYGTLRSGGDTKFRMFCDLIGIRCIVILMSLLAAAVWRLSLHWAVALSFSNELVKAMVILWRLRSKRWIHVPVHRGQEYGISDAQCLKVCYYIHIKSKRVIHTNHLSAQKAKYVISLFGSLFLYVYRIENRKAEVTTDNLEHLCRVGSTIVFRNEQLSRRLISQYLKFHPQLPREDAAYITKSQGCCKQQLYVMMHEQEYTFVLDRRGRTLYGIKGTTDSPNFLLRNQTLPCMVQYAILPYKNHLILDSTGNTQAIVDLSFVVELLEEYCGTAMGRGALLLEHKTTLFSMLEHNIQEKKEEFFSDHLNPLNAILWSAGQDQKNSSLELVLTAWNLSYGSDRQTEEFFPRDVFRRYVKPLMEYRRTAFANAKFLIDRPEAPLEGETYTRVAEKKGIEQLELEL